MEHGVGVEDGRDTPDEPEVVPEVLAVTDDLGECPTFLVNVVPVDIDERVQDALGLPDEDGLDDPLPPEDPDVLEWEDQPRFLLALM